MGHGSSLGRKETDKVSAISHVRGYGASGNGVSEWIGSRITAIIGAHTSVYVLFALILGVANTYMGLIEWLSNPLNATMLVLTIIMLCWHGALGVITVINDYIHHDGMNLFLKILTKVFFSFTVVISIICILFVVFASFAKGVF